MKTVISLLSRVIDDAITMFQQAVSGGMCQDTSRRLDDFCAPILTGTPPINPPPTTSSSQTLPTTEQSSTADQTATTSTASTTQAPGV